MKIASRLAEIKPSATLDITAKAKAMKDAGVDVVSLGAGEPDFDTPAPVVEAAVKALQEGFTRYTPVGGIPALIEAVIQKLHKENGLEFSPKEVLVSCGAKHSLYNAFMALLDPGDEILIPTPAWLSYPEMVRLAAGRPVFVPTREEDGFLTDAKALQKHVTRKTRALIVNSPSNPTGSGYDAKQLDALGEFALKNKLLVISDEIYEKLVYGGFRHVSIASLSPELKAATLVVNGHSKSYAMTGWRLGYAAGPKDLIEAMRIIQSHSTSNPTSFAQKGGVAALHTPPEVVGRMVREFAKRRDYIVGRLRKMPRVTCYDPRGAFYVFPNFSRWYGAAWEKGTIDSSMAMAEFLLEKAMVAVIPGAAFESDDHLRLSFAISMDDLKKAADRIDEALKLLA